MAEAKALPKFWTPRRLFVSSLIVVAVVWGTVFIIAVSAGSDVDKRGQFGDAFGVVSALFTGLAFVGAGTAAYLQREQLAAQRLELEQAAAAERRNVVESRFFQLLGSWQTMLNSVGIDTYVGRQAVLKLFERLERNQKVMRKTFRRGAGVDPHERHEDIRLAYKAFYDGRVIDGKVIEEPSGYLIGNYFRLLYHILKYVREHVPDAAERKFYRRIVRAHLSSPELVLILYNGLSDWGYPGLFLEINDADLLHNLQEASLLDDEDGRLYELLNPPRPDGWK